uniref:NADH-ubiquinone oxidoreductase chain 2 n=1 Tax=Eusyllis blomstrandi TaxID=199554 RepID=A0A1C9UZB0_EUSBL|nr:NADH dehydrogenase subunit 2 [Eusyllis blomstrandi]AOR87112.1 NADH dehydrogenase subunit 2 [Eusyllis blomstrandi]
MILHFLPYNLLFSFTITSSLFMVLNSNNWLFIWLGLELNLFSFIPMIFSSNTNMETEGAVKYFLIQTISSGILISCMLMKMSPFYAVFPHSIINIFIMLSMLMKIGAAPCHFWFPQVMSSMNWMNCFILMTIQKLNPLFIISSMLMMWSSSFMLALILMNSLISGLGGMNQTQMRPLMAYSSIGHLSWMLAMSGSSFSYTIFYFSFYLIISMSLLIMFMNLMKQLNSQFNMLFQLPQSINTLIFLSLLSLGGLPPLLGFLPKWIIINKLMIVSPFLLMILVGGSLLALFYYLVVFFTMILNNFKSLKINLLTMKMNFMWLMSSSTLLLLVMF